MEEEFDAIWAVQAPHHPDVLTEDVYKRLREIIFYQRPLRAPQIEKCTLLPDEERLPKAHPLFQRGRLLKELNALMIVRPGEVAQRRLARFLCGSRNHSASEIAVQRQRHGRVGGH